LLHEIERRYYDGTTFLRIIVFGKPTNGRVFNKSVGDIVSGVESNIMDQLEEQGIVSAAQNGKREVLARSSEY
jgi:outer-membrane lipoprotein carrier protein